MVKIMAAVIVTLLVALGFVGWRGEAARATAEIYRKTNEQLTAAVDRQNRLAEEQQARQRDFDESMSRLQQGQAQSGAQLLLVLKTLSNFQPEPGDTDETVRCAGLPVPAAVDRQLRD